MESAGHLYGRMLILPVQEDKVFGGFGKAVSTYGTVTYHLLQRAMCCTPDHTPHCLAGKKDG